MVPHRGLETVSLFDSCCQFDDESMYNATEHVDVACHGMCIEVCGDSCEIGYGAVCALNTSTRGG